jgi:hypothetical protein
MGGLNSSFFYRTLPIVAQVACKKQSNINTNNKPPQPHKIKVQETKNLQQLVELQKLVHKSQPTTSNIK